MLAVWIADRSAFFYTNDIYNVLFHPQVGDVVMRLSYTVVVFIDINIQIVIVFYVSMHET